MSVSKRDYYELLGVKKTASGDELKKAFRAAALKHHPDRNQGDPEAEQRFKDVNEAYDVLSDPSRRKLYDTYGHAGLESQGYAAPEDIFSQFQDLFADFFGGSFGGGGRGGPGQRRGGGQPGGAAQRNRPMQGRDIRVGVRLSLKEAAFGSRREVNVVFPTPCDECSGSGAAKGTGPTTCPTCKGRGQVQHGGMGIMIAMPCNDCGGSGQVIARPCPACRGRGEVRSEKRVKVAIPAGIDHGQAVRVPQQGEPGHNGGPPGHLLVVVEVEPDQKFHREDSDLMVEVPVQFTTAALGGTVSLTNLDERLVEVTIPPGTQPGSPITIPGQGVPYVDGSGRGNLVAVVRLEVPRRLSEGAKQALMEFQRAVEAPEA